MILLYKPVWLGQLHKDVKEAGIKCTMTQLQVGLNSSLIDVNCKKSFQDWLDLECITYRIVLEQQGNEQDASLLDHAIVVIRSPRLKLRLDHLINLYQFQIIV